MKTLETIATTASGNPARVAESTLINLVGNRALIELIEKNIITPWGRICINMFEISINNWKYENAYLVNLNNL